MENTKESQAQCHRKADTPGEHDATQLAARQVQKLGMSVLPAQTGIQIAARGSRLRGKDDPKPKG
jgi:hypothetical protein